MSKDVTEADVERLAAMWYTPANWKRSGHHFKETARIKARRLLEGGVTLPVEPPKRRERYESLPWDGHWAGVKDRNNGGIVVNCYYFADPSKNEELVERIARLLNLDAKYEGGVEVEVDAWRNRVKELEADLASWKDKASTRGVKATALALEDARTELAEVMERGPGATWSKALGEERRRAEKAERELAEARANITTYRRHFVKMKAERDALAGSTDAPPDRCAYCGARTVECRSKRAEQGDPCCGGCTHEGPERDATGPTDTATEPHPFCRADHCRPTPTVTAELLEASLAPCEIGRYLTFDRDALAELADALNRLLAEQGGEASYDFTTNMRAIRQMGGALAGLTHLADDVRLRITFEYPVAEQGGEG